MTRESNTTPMNVHNWVRAEEKRTGQKIAPRRQSFTLEQKKEAIRLVREGRSFADAARESNATPMNVRNWVRAEEKRTGQKIAPRQQSFTLEQKKEAIRLVGEGRSFADAARESNTNRENVRNWVRAEEQRTGLKIAPRQQNVTLEQKREAIRLVREGRIFADVARELNISSTSVSDWVRAEEQRAGQIIPRRKHRFTLEQKREAIRLVGEGRGFADVARELSTTSMSVFNWVRVEEQRTGQEISPRKHRFTLEQKREAIRLVREGRSFADAARELSTTSMSVLVWVRAEEQRTGQQIAPRQQNLTLEQKKEAVRLVGEGRSFADVARELDTIPMNVNNWVRAEEQGTGQQIAHRQQNVTLEQKREAIRLVGEGRSLTGVASELNISSTSVCKWVRAEEQRTGRQIAPRKHRFTLEQKREVIRSVEDGRSFVDVARESNTTPVNVRNWVRTEEQRTGRQIAPRKQSLTLEQKKEAIHLVGEGRSFADVAKELNISSSSVSDWIRAEEQRTGQKIPRQKHSSTLEQKREAIRLIGEGRSFADVARELNISSSSVSGWIRAEEQRTGQNISPQKHCFTLEQKREAIRLVGEGRSFADVARELNTTSVSVRDWVRAEEQRTGRQIAPRTHRITLEQKREAIRLVGEGRSFADVARELNISSSSVSYWVQAEEQRAGQKISLRKYRRTHRFTLEQKREMCRRET